MGLFSKNYVLNVKCDSNFFVISENLQNYSTVMHKFTNQNQNLL